MVLRHAFPLKERTPNTSPMGRQKGLNLLEYFAGQALVGLAASGRYGDDAVKTAHSAWGMARALLRTAPVSEDPLGPAVLVYEDDDEGEDDPP